MLILSSCHSSCPFPLLVRTSVPKRRPWSRDSWRRQVLKHIYRAKTSKKTILKHKEPVTSKHKQNICWNTCSNHPKVKQPNQFPEKNKPSAQVGLTDEVIRTELVWVRLYRDAMERLQRMAVARLGAFGNRLGELGEFGRWPIFFRFFIFVCLDFF